MTTVTVTQAPDPRKSAQRQREQERCRRLGITHDMIAAHARCHRTGVVHYFKARRSPQAVADAIKALLAEHGRTVRNDGA